MLRFVKVFCSVLVLGRVAAADVPANKTQAQVHPRISHFEALFTNMFVGLLDFDLVKMRALIRHIPSPVLLPTFTKQCSLQIANHFRVIKPTTLKRDQVLQVSSSSPRNGNSCRI
jgi:hypothetical protein